MKFTICTRLSAETKLYTAFCISFKETTTQTQNKQGHSRSKLILHIIHCKDYYTRRPLYDLHFLLLSNIYYHRLRKAFMLFSKQNYCSVYSYISST